MPNERDSSHMAARYRRIALLVVLAGLAARPVPAEAGPERSFVIIARRAYTAALDGPAFIERPVIVVREGRIEAIGPGLTPPPDLPVIRLPDETVMPGLVDAANRLGGAHRGDESVAAGYKAVDTYDAYADYAELLAGGVTTVHLNPGAHRLVSGQGAVVKLGGLLDRRVLLGRSDLTINLGRRAFNPPRDVTFSHPASADVAIPPAIRQRPDSRLGQMRELEERIAAARNGRLEGPASRRFHDEAFRDCWQRRSPLRIQVRRAADIGQAVAFAERHGHPAYLVGVEEGLLLADDLRIANLPLVVQVDAVFGRPLADIGPDPEALDPQSSNAAALADSKFALAGSFDSSPGHLRLAAATAVRAGVSPTRALEAITRIPAEILGVSNRIGSLEPGKDADLLVLSGNPLDAAVNVMTVYVGGSLAFEAPQTDALVVKAGTIWTGNAGAIRDGAVLIEDGKIAAVGPTVPRPMFARVIDAGPDAFVTPGFVDAHGHLGLEGDRTTVDTAVPLADVVGYAGPQARRVARAGVTTVMLGGYQVAARGGRIAAIKSAGQGRDELVVRQVAAVQFRVRDADPLLGTKQIKSALEAGKKYVEKWKKYEKELKEWAEAKAVGRKVERADDGEVEIVQEGAPDPITGTWEVTLSGDPLPETMTAEMLLKLEGNKIEGRLRIPGEAEEATITGTLNGRHISAVIDVETPMGQPTVEAELDREDHMVGTISLADYQIAMEATRTDKSDVEFKVSRRKKRGKGGRPLPPKVDEALEPIRSLLEKKIPAVVDVDTPAAIEAVLKLLVDDHELPVILLNAEGAEPVASRIADTKAGVIVPTRITYRHRRRPYNPSASLPRRGIPVAFQSNAEDGARGLPLQCLYAVQQGSDPETVLRSLTYDAARMFKLDDRIGSLQPGRDADLVIFSGHPFEAGTRTERVIVGGEEVLP